MGRVIRRIDADTVALDDTVTTTVSIADLRRQLRQAQNYNENLVRHYEWYNGLSETRKAFVHLPVLMDTAALEAQIAAYEAL